MDKENKRHRCSLEFCIFIFYVLIRLSLISLFLNSLNVLTVPETIDYILIRLVPGHYTLLLKWTIPNRVKYVSGIYYSISKLIDS